MSWPDMMTPWDAGPAPELPLLDFLSRSSEIGFCADCFRDGRACPDHRQYPVVEPSHPLTGGPTS